MVFNFSPRVSCEPPVRVLLAGVGRWGQNIARSLRQVERARLSAVCDPNPPSREALDLLSGGEAPPACFRALQPALELADAVIIAAPDAAHVPLALSALRAGKHVLVEKPMALAVSDAERLLASAREHERTLMVGHVLNYHPAIERMQGALRSGRIGRLVFLQSERFVEHAGPGVDAWWALAPHDLSLGRRFLGEARALWASPSRVGEPRAEVRALLDYYFEDHSEHDPKHLLATGDGAQARLHVSQAPRQPRRRRLLLAGSEGTLVFDDEPLAPTLGVWPALGPRALERIEGRSAERLRWPASDALLMSSQCREWLPIELEPRPLVRELQHFISAVTRGTQPLTDAHEGLAVVRLLEAGMGAGPAARARRRGLDAVV